MNRFRVLGIVGDDEGSRNNGQWLLSKWSSEETQLVEEAPQSPNISLGSDGVTRIK
jgi:hypothetical protein